MSDGVGPRRAACADLSGGAAGRVASRLFDADRLSKIEAMSLVRLRVPSVLVATCNGCATVRSADAGRDALDCSGAPADEYCADIMHTVYWAAGHDKRASKSAHQARSKRSGWENWCSWPERLTSQGLAPRRAHMQGRRALLHHACYTWRHCIMRGWWPLARVVHWRKSYITCIFLCYLHVRRRLSAARGIGYGFSGQKILSR